jgi:hypothetical protein
MAQHITYLLETGEIDGYITCSDSVLQRMIAGLSDNLGVLEYMSGIDKATHYVDGNTIRLRTESSCSINATELTIPSGGKATVFITDLPIPCTIEIIDVYKEIVTDGEFSASTAIPGTYKIKMTSVQCFNKEWEVVINGD